jgi:hypothetical protein
MCTYVDHVVDGSYTKDIDPWRMSVIINKTQEGLQLKWYVVKRLVFFYQGRVFNLFYVRLSRKIVINECAGDTYVSEQVNVYLGR